MGYYRGKRIKVNGKPDKFKGYIGSNYYLTVKNGKVEKKNIDR